MPTSSRFMRSRRWPNTRQHYFKRTKAALAADSVVAMDYFLTEVVPDDEQPRKCRIQLFDGLCLRRRSCRLMANEVLQAFMLGHGKLQVKARELSSAQSVKINIEPNGLVLIRPMRPQDANLQASAFCRELLLGSSFCNIFSTSIQSAIPYWNRNPQSSERRRGPNRALSSAP